VLAASDHECDARGILIMPTVRANGIEIYYELHGQGDPLVLIMGLRRNAEWWYRQLPVLSRHFTVLAFDNRGAGRSDKPAVDYSIPLFSDDTAALMASLDIRNAHVIGISMGGYIAQELAVNHPEMVRNLVLGCTGAGGETAVLMSPEGMKKFTANEGLSREQILRKDMGIYFSDRFIREYPEEINEFVEISLRHYQPPDAFLRQLAACLAHDTADRLHRIKIPTLILSGDDDPLVPPENSCILKKLILHAELLFLQGGRHGFFIELSERFNRTVVDFLKCQRQQS
jgi:pimeloyl-ACP methyl ester carboxylesterase